MTNKMCIRDRLYIDDLVEGMFDLLEGKEEHCEFDGVETVACLLYTSPPMGALIDGAIVARHCDGAVLVIESGAVSWRIEQKLSLIHI